MGIVGSTSVHTSCLLIERTDMELKQDTQLYISDPKALHNILIKDQYVFEETSGFIVYVIPASVLRSPLCERRPTHCMPVRFQVQPYIFRNELDRHLG